MENVRNESREKSLVLEEEVEYVTCDGYIVKLQHIQAEGVEGAFWGDNGMRYSKRCGGVALGSMAGRHTLVARLDSLPAELVSIARHRQTLSGIRSECRDKELEVGEMFQNKAERFLHK